MKTMKRMLMLGLAVGIVFLCLVGCSSEEQTLSVAKEGNPVPMLMIDGEQYFDLSEKAPDRTEKIGAISTSVEADALLDEDWQTNCGLVGCEVYATEQKNVVCVKDGRRMRAFARPEPSEFAGSAPIDQSNLPPEDVVDGQPAPGLMLQGVFYNLDSRPKDWNDVPTDMEEVGVVLRTSYRISSLDFSSNCGYVGYRLYRSPSQPKHLYLAYQGMVYLFEDRS